MGDSFVELCLKKWRVMLKMDGKKILICYDNKEEALASALEGCIKKVFNESNNEEFEVVLCSSSSDWKNKIGEPADNHLIFVLCSPFSIWQPWINFISGAATINAEEKARIIPICHSGQKSKDLPHYLMSRQAMDIQHERFIDALISTLLNKIEKPGHDKEYYKRFSSPDFGTDEFENGKTIENLCEAINKDGYSLANSLANSIDSLNKVLDVQYLYEQVIEKKKSQKPSEALKKLKTSYDKSKLDRALKELNRRILEDYYPNETPQSLRFKIDEALREVIKGPSVPSDSSLFCEEEFNNNGFTIKGLCEIITKDNYGIYIKSDFNTIEWLNEVLQRIDLYGLINGKGKLSDDSKTRLQGLKSTYDKSQCRQDIIKLNRGLLEEVYPAKAPKKNDPNVGKMDYTLFQLKKEADRVIVSFNVSTTDINLYCDEEKRLNKVGEMHSFLLDPAIPEIDGAGVSMGIQNCLFDGKNIYVGLKMEAEVDENFKSFCASKGVFEPGYELLTQAPRSKEELHDIGKEFNGKDVDDRISGLMKQRVEAMGRELWHIKFSDGQTAVATVFVNNSGQVPRFEIGVWKFIAISSDEFKKKFNDKLDKHGIIDGFGNDEDNNQFYYWIWVRNGEIYYWSFPKEKLIPRYISSNEKSWKQVLVKTCYMTDTYTPFAPDDALGVENVVKDRFSAAARHLLSCF
jgi:hypothetical protein